MQFTNTELIIGGFSAIATIISTVLSYKVAKAKSKLETRQSLMEAEENFRKQLMECINELRARLSVVEADNDKLKKELFLAELKIKELEAITAENFNIFGVFENFISNIPFPSWVSILDESNQLSVSFINERYTDTWGFSKSFCVNNTNENIWGQEISDDLKKIVNEVIYYKRPTCALIMLPYNQTNMSVKVPYLISKFPVIINNKLICIGGIAICMKDMCKDAFKTKKTV